MLVEPGGDRVGHANRAPVLGSQATGGVARTHHQRVGRARGDDDARPCLAVLDFVGRDAERDERVHHGADQFVVVAESFELAEHRDGASAHRLRDRLFPNVGPRDVG